MEIEDNHENGDGSEKRDGDPNKENGDADMEYQNI